MRAGVGWIGIALAGLVLASCKGSGEGAAEATPAEEPSPVVEATPAEASTPAVREPAGDGATIARYGEHAFAVGDRVELAERAGLIEAPGDRGKVEASEGKSGTVTAVLDPEGLVEVTWDAQAWPLHGGYAFEGKEQVELGDIQDPRSRSAGVLQLEPFATPVHVRFLALSGS